MTGVEGGNSWDIEIWWPIWEKDRKENKVQISIGVCAQVSLVELKDDTEGVITQNIDRIWKGEKGGGKGMA